MSEQEGKAVLEEIADREGYDLMRMFWEGHWARYLRWGEASHVENPAYFDHRFPEVPTFEYRLDHTFPTVTFLKSYLGDEWKEHLLWYRELAAPYAENEGMVPPEQLPALAARRDALQKQIIRNGERLRLVFEEVRAILKVWIVEAEQGILQDRKISSLSDDAREEILSELDELKRTGRQLWTHLTRGTPRRALEKNWLPKALYWEGLPRQVAEAQGSGARLQLLKRDQIIEETIPIHRRWWALEVLLKRALIGEPVMTEEEAKKSQPKPQPDRHSFKWNKTWERRTRNMATIVLARNEKEELVPSPSWSDAEPQKLFKELAKQQGEEHLDGETPWRSIKRYFQRKFDKMDESMPSDIEGWIAKAREWGKSVPPGFFDKR